MALAEDWKGLVWFRDGRRVPADGKNPDCSFFERNAPELVLPLCDERGGLIDPERQKKIVRALIADFFDGYLKQDEKARERLRRAGLDFSEVTLTRKD